jgi:membrane protein implicated in regulation of membrane protease activity
MMDSINTVLPFADVLFSAMLALGTVYILAILLLGGLGDVADVNADIDTDFDFGADADVDFSGDTGAVDVETGDTDTDEALGISLNVLAAFSVGVGAMGLVASLNDWSVLLTLLASLLFGLLLGRFFQVSMGWLIRQQGGDVRSSVSLIGLKARVTVDTPAGSLGEALIEEPERMKYTIQHLQDAPLNKGDTVQVVEVEGSRLKVRRVE